MRTLWLFLVLAALTGCNVSIPLLPGGMVGGTWGGDNAGLLADDTSAHVHIACTYGNVHQPILPDVDGGFAVAGEHNISAYPVGPGVFHPAQFTGSIRGRTMTLTVTLTDTAVTLGPVSLTYEKDPKMGPCPICRSNAERAQAMRRSSTGLVRTSVVP